MHDGSSVEPGEAGASVAVARGRKGGGKYLMAGGRSRAHAGRELRYSPQQNWKCV